MRHRDDVMITCSQHSAGRSVAAGGCTATGDVVVGVDDSAASRLALRAAAAEASRRGLTLRVIHVWHAPVAEGVPLAEATSGERMRYQQLSEWLAGEVAACSTERHAAGQLPVNLTADVVVGDPVTELRAAARGASLLVVGERHHRGPSELLSSVSHDVAAHPPCPVLIVPAAWR
jgi:nucleotide-binding universal stress UspA family protein